MAEHKLIALLRALAEAEVDFIVVGGLAAALEGATVDTYDVDVVHSRDAANIARLLPVLESLDAVFRIQPERRLRPAASHLAGPGHLNLITRYGPLDVLGTIGRGLGFEDLLPHSSKMDVGGGIHVRVLDLETLIALKEELAGEKDRAMLPLLRRALAEKKARGTT
jgi:predicted nucleotidyltransferase